MSRLDSITFFFHEAGRQFATRGGFRTSASGEGVGRRGPPPHLLIIVYCCAEEIAFWDRIRPLCDMLKEEFFLLFKKPSQAAQTTSALKSSLVKIWLKYCLGRVQDNNIVVQAKLPEIFGDLNATYMKIESRIKAEAYKQRVMACFRAWEVSHCFVPLSIFLGI